VKQRVRDEIPETFETAEEAAEFWNSHSAADFLDQMTDVTMQVDPDVRNQQVIQVELSVDLLDLLDDRSRRTGQKVDEIIVDLVRKELVPTR